MKAFPRLFSRQRDATSRARGRAVSPQTGADGGEASLFPLPLVPFEAMMRYDNWPDYPMTCGATFSFDGQVDRQALQTAVAMASERHPLLRCRICQTGFAKWSWVHATDQLQVRWIDEGPATEFAACNHYNLEVEPGTRIWARSVGQTTEMYFEFHHACSDGAGGLNFAEDVLGYYACCVDGANHTLPPPLDHSMLRKRGEFAKSKKSPMMWCRAAASDWATTWRLLTSRPSPVAQRAGPRPPRENMWQDHRYVTRRFDRRVLLRLRRSAAERGATLNDLLTRDLFLTIHEWNKSYGHDHSDGMFRIVVPINLRKRADLKLPAANRLSYAFVGRRRRELATPDRLLESIAAESTWIRRSCLPQGLLQKLAALDALRIGLPLIFKPDRCLATATFSNLGDPTRRFRIRFPRRDGKVAVGNLLMTDFSGTTALRPLTRAGLFFNTYGNRLTISARFDPAYFSVADAGAFLDLYASHIGATPLPQEDQVRRAA